MTADEIFAEFSEKSRELTDRSIEDLHAKMDAVSASITAIVSPRIVVWQHYRGELTADGREIVLAHGNVILPPNAVVRTATPQEAADFREFREITRRELERWYALHPHVCD